MGKVAVVILVLAVILLGAFGFGKLGEAPQLEGVTDTTLITENVILIAKEYASEEAMHLAASTDGVPEGGYVLISSNVEDPDNAKLYIKGADGYELVTDLSGAKGEQGPQGLQGKDGAAGQAGVTPMLKISATTGMWEVSYDFGTTWESLGVQAQGPQGDRGYTGATGPQGPAYVLTPEDKQAIINAVLKQLGNGDSGESGDSGGDSTELPEHPEVMYVYNGEFEPIYEPSTQHTHLSICEYCGAWVFNNGEEMSYCYAGGCSNIDGYFTTNVNPYLAVAHYYASDAQSEWSTEPYLDGSYDCVWESDCGAKLHVMDGIYDTINACPHCYQTHSGIMWNTN